MNYVDKLKFSCNGINLVYRSYGKYDDRNGLYIIDEKTGDVLTEGMSECSWYIEQDRYIVIMHKLNYDTDRITIYDCLERRCLANNYKCREIQYYGNNSWIRHLDNLYVVIFPDNREHLLDFRLLGTDKDIFKMGADCIRVFYVDNNTYQLGISVDDEIKLYDKSIGINNNLELEGFSLDKANIYLGWFEQRIHILKNKITGKKRLVMSKINSNNNITYEFDSYEYDNIYFLFFNKSMVPILDLNCFEENGKLSVFYHSFGCGSIDKLRESKMFEVKGTDIDILNQIDTDDFLGDGHCYEIYFSYTNELGNKGILKFIETAFDHSGELYYETDKKLKIDSISKISLDSDNRSKWPSSVMAVPVYYKGKMGFYSYKNNGLVVPKYKNIIPCSDKLFFCYIDDNHFDVIRRVDVFENNRSKEFIFWLENCEIVYRENDDNVIVFKNKNSKYGVYISSDKVENLDDVIVYKREFDDKCKAGSSFGLFKDGKLGFLYQQQTSSVVSSYEELECNYKDIKVYQNNNISFAIAKNNNDKYELVIVFCYPNNFNDWRELVSFHEGVFDEIITNDNFIFLRDRNIFSSIVYSLNSGRRIGEFSSEVEVKRDEDNRIIFIDDNNSYIYDRETDSIVKEVRAKMKLKEKE